MECNTWAGSEIDRLREVVALLDLRGCRILSAGMELGTTPHIRITAPRRWRERGVLTVDAVRIIRSSAKACTEYRCYMMGVSVTWKCMEDYGNG